MRIRVTYPAILKQDLLDTLFDEEIRKPPKNREGLVRKARDAVIGSNRTPEILRRAVVSSPILDQMSQRTDIEFSLLEEKATEAVIGMEIIGPNAFSEKQIWDGIDRFGGAKRQMKRILDNFCDINKIPRDSCKAEMVADGSP